MGFKDILSKINSGIIKIPTLVGVGILLIGLTAGVYLATQNQILKSKAAVNSLPKNVNVVNLSATSAAIYWQTDESAPGFIQAGISTQQKSTYRDDRDLNAPQLHKLHFVTLTNLSAATTYYYQIYSGSSVYPNTPATFTTSQPITPLNWSPLVGTVLDTDKHPVSEALIILELTGAQKMATITKIGGNFILPLSNLKIADLTDSFPEEKTPYTAKLIIFGPLNNTQTTISVPPQDTALHPIVLTNTDSLAEPTEQNLISPTTTPKTVTPSAGISSYDLNGDGVIDETDLSIVLKNFGPNPQNPKADLNGNGTIDQHDADLIIPYLK